jgi:hypothetical protein
VFPARFPSGRCAAAASRHSAAPVSPRHLVAQLLGAGGGFSTNHAEVRHLVSRYFRRLYFGFVEVTRPHPAGAYHCNRATALFDSLGADRFVHISAGTLNCIIR